MSRESARDYVLLALDAADTYALGCIVQAHIVTAGHVADGGPLFTTVDGREHASVILNRDPVRDVAISQDEALVPGYNVAKPPRLGDTLSIVGYRGPKRQPFTVTARVDAMKTNGRIIVRRTGGDIPAVGMSGAPALTIQQEVAGILVASDDELSDGYVLEGLHTLFSRPRE